MSLFCNSDGEFEIYFYWSLWRKSNLSAEWAVKNFIFLYMLYWIAWLISIAVLLSLRTYSGISGGTWGPSKRCFNIYCSNIRCSTSASYQNLTVEKDSLFFVIFDRSQIQPNKPFSLSSINCLVITWYFSLFKTNLLNK